MIGVLRRRAGALARYFVLALAAPLPWPLKGRLLRLCLGYKLDPSARIGLSLIDCKDVELGPDARVGHFCVIQGLDRFKLGAASVVGNMTWIKAPKEDDLWFAGRDRDPSCVIGHHTILTARHNIDCSDAVTIGDWSMLAGGQTLVLTHEIDINQEKPACSPVHIGDRCLIHARVTLRAGTRLPAGTVVAAGAIVAESPPEGYKLHGGVPARPLKDLDPDAYFFTREAYGGDAEAL